MGTTPSYQPHIVESFAAQLDARARSVVLAITAIGALVGGVLGAIPLTPLDMFWDLPAAFGLGTTLAGALVGGLVGRAVGNRRANVHQLHAQTVLSQLHAQRATLAIWRLLRAQQEEDATGDDRAERHAVVPATPLPEPDVEHASLDAASVSPEPEVAEPVDPQPEPVEHLEPVEQVEPTAVSFEPTFAPPPVVPPVSAAPLLSVEAVPTEPAPAQPAPTPTHVAGADAVRRATGAGRGHLTAPARPHCAVRTTACRRPANGRRP
jgi:hypothetical protein